MVRSGQHNTLSRPNEHHIWLFECFGLMQGQATQWRGETEAMCLTGSGLLLLSVSLPPSRSLPSVLGTRRMFIWFTLEFVQSYQNLE